MLHISIYHSQLLTDFLEPQLNSWLSAKMHFNVLVTIALATRALAESLTDAINEFPACSLRCLEDRAKDQGCQLTDSDCICKSQVTLAVKLGARAGTSCTGAYYRTGADRIAQTPEWLSATSALGGRRIRLLPMSLLPPVLLPLWSPRLPPRPPRRTPQSVWTLTWTSFVSLLLLLLLGLPDTHFGSSQSVLQPAHRLGKYKHPTHQLANSLLGLKEHAVIRII